MKRLLTLIICAAWLHTANAGAADSGAVMELGLAEYEIGHYAAAAQQFRRAAVAAERGSRPTTKRVAAAP
jgi:hypothetical protein